MEICGDCPTDWWTDGQTWRSQRFRRLLCELNTILVLRMITAMNSCYLPDLHHPTGLHSVDAVCSVSDRNLKVCVLHRLIWKPNFMFSWVNVCVSLNPLPFATVYYSILFFSLQKFRDLFLLLSSLIVFCVFVLRLDFSVMIFDASTMDATNNHKLRPVIGLFNST
jgi:hypothetical protein